MLENISLSFQGIWSHKMRSFLTMLGIIIGIASIITIVSTIKGTNEQIKENLIGSGNNVVEVKLMQDSWEADLSYSAIPDGIGLITEEKRAELDSLEGVAETSLYNIRNWCNNVYYGNTSFEGKMIGVDSHYFSVYGYQVISGRTFVADDFEHFRKVMVITQKTATGLMSGVEPVGKTVEVNGEPYVIIGVVAPKSSSSPTIKTLNDYYMYSDTSAGSMYIPNTTWPVIYQYDEPQNVAVRANSTDEMTIAGNNVADALAGLITNDTYSYKANNLLEQASNLQSLSETTNNQLIWIAGISLLVGGIGVMNIMLVSVTERTREIGLKKALGARRNRILWQFLTEAGVLTCMGGLFGVACGIGLAQLMSSIMGTPVSISVPACLIAVAFSMIIGIVFGLMPAFKASRLNPIEALRYE